MTHKPVRTGLIGLGSIGLSLVDLANEQADEIEIVGALVREPWRERPGIAIPVVGTAAELLKLRPSVVAEVAGHEGLQQHGPSILRAGIDVVIVAVGALAEPATEAALLDAARAGGARLRIASGAIGGLDAIAAARFGGLARVTHTTRKPPASLLSEAEAASLSEPLELFRGSAREGALKFPESINVAAAVSFAGLGLDRTEVVVLADPAVDRNRHVVEASGAFGELRFEIANVPSERNPRTGRLTAMSVLHELLKREATLAVG
jgi:aspartate dehydrogenase